MNILFVCTGNTCRSPMAEAIAKGVIKGDGERMAHIKVASAGTMGVLGVGASTNAILAVEGKGGRLDHFVSQPLTEELINAADLIFVMTYSHKQQVLQIVPEAREKTFLLKEYTRENSTDQIIAGITEGYAKLQEGKHQFVADNKEKFNQLEEIRHAEGEDSNRYKEYLMALEKEMQDYTTKLQQELIQLQQEMRVFDVIDPYGGTLPIYQACCEELEKEVVGILNQLVYLEKD